MHWRAWLLAERVSSFVGWVFAILAWLVCLPGFFMFEVSEKCGARSTKARRALFAETK